MIDLSEVVFNEDKEKIKYKGRYYTHKITSSRHVFIIEGVVLKLEYLDDELYQNEQECRIYNLLSNYDRKYFPKFYGVEDLGGGYSISAHEFIKVNRTLSFNQRHHKIINRLSERYRLVDICPEDRNEDAYDRDANTCLTKDNQLKILDYGV